MNYLAKDKIHLVDYSKHGVLYEWFSNIVSKYGNKTALISDSRSISFNEAKYIVDDVIRLEDDTNSNNLELSTMESIKSKIY